MQRRREIVRMCARYCSQLCFDVRELIDQHRLKQRDFAREMGVKRFLAHGQLRCQIVHAHAAKSVAEEVRPCRFYDSLTTGIGRSLSRNRVSHVFHVLDDLKFFLLMSQSMSEWMFRPMLD